MNVGNWMASITGTTVGRAKATIETAAQLDSLPSTEAALRSGALSDVQVDAITTAATANPRAERSLLRKCGVRRCQRSEGPMRRGGSRSINGSGRAIRASPKQALHPPPAPVRCRRIARDARPVGADLRGDGSAGAIRIGALRSSPASGLREEPRRPCLRRHGAAHRRRRGPRFASNPSRAPSTVVYRVDHSAFGSRPHRSGRGLRDRWRRPRRGRGRSAAVERRGPQGTHPRRHRRLGGEPPRAQHSGPIADCDRGAVPRVRDSGVSHESSPRDRSQHARLCRRAHRDRELGRVVADITTATNTSTI